MTQWQLISNLKRCNWNWPFNQVCDDSQKILFFVVRYKWWLLDAKQKKREPTNID